MVSLYLTKCLRILDHQQVEVVVVIAVYLVKDICSAVFIKQKVSKILMFVISGDQDILKDNETYNDYLVVSYIWWRYKARHI